MSDKTNNSNILSLFEPFDDEWKSTTRSIRINGKVTSVRLENFYWRIIREIAENMGVAVPQLMTVLSKTARNSEPETDHTNFTSFIRVCCGRYILQRKAGTDSTNPDSGAGEQDKTTQPATTLEADQTLSGED